MARRKRPDPKLFRAALSGCRDRVKELQEKIATQCEQAGEAPPAGREAKQEKEQNKRRSRTAAAGK